MVPQLKSRHQHYRVHRIKERNKIKIQSDFMLYLMNQVNVEKQQLIYNTGILYLNSFKEQMMNSHLSLSNNYNASIKIANIQCGRHC